MSHRVTACRLSDGRYVCHGTIWQSLDALIKKSLVPFFRPYELLVTDADANTEAFWLESERNGTCKVQS